MHNTQSQPQPAPSTRIEASTASQAPASLSSSVLQPSPTIDGGSTKSPDSSSFDQVIKKIPASTELERAMCRRLFQAIANEAPKWQAENDKALSAQELLSQSWQTRQRSQTPENQVGNAVKDPKLLNAPERVPHKHPNLYIFKTVLDIFDQVKSGQVRTWDLKTTKDEDDIVRPADEIKYGSVLDTLTEDESRLIAEFDKSVDFPTGILFGTKAELQTYIQKCNEFILKVSRKVSI
ncbi:hypothetical protein F5878DRAFT_634899 [Lentinula raphanica]|uniref:Uncharacterized protein n=1 Tax=Lentinula raphanica TaxID=153919 RepID=A0AA38NXM9_9AGAR|nr:hypothetical protein F5878DRAFT_634899 [Lentinula raphanica]